MRDELARLRAALRQVQPIDHVVESPLEQLQERASGLARNARRLAEIVSELRLVDAVITAHLLLLAQLTPVLRDLRPRFIAGRFLTGSRAAPLDRTHAGKAAVALEEQLNFLARFAGRR